MKQIYWIVALAYQDLGVFAWEKFGEFAVLDGNVPVFEGSIEEGYDGRRCEGFGGQLEVGEELVECLLCFDIE